MTQKSLLCRRYFENLNFLKIIFSLLLVLLCFFSLVSSVKAQCQPGGAPQLSAVPGPGFKQVTLSWTGVSGSNTYYSIYGSANGGATYGDPLSRGAQAGQSVSYVLGSWGINAGLDTNKTYYYYLQTSICGTITQSNVVSVTTRDIDAPVLTATTSSEFDKLKVTFTAVPGASLNYGMRISPNANGPFSNYFGAAFSSEGEEKTFTYGFWDVNSPMLPNTTYYFYTTASSGTRKRQSNIVSATTRDIQAPVLSITQEGNKARLSWSTVEGAERYVVYTFSSAQNQWNSLASVSSPLTTYLDPQLTPNQTRYYYVAAVRKGRFKPSNTVSTAFYQDQNLGNTDCNLSRGEPVNLSNGNMYLNQTDFSLQAGFENLEVTRTYNSGTQFSGLFGDGWSSIFDENIIVSSNYSLRYMMSDGRAVYFGRTDTSQPFVPSSAGFYGQFVQNGSTYTLTLKNGYVKTFRSDGRLLSITDRNGNQTTLNYDANGILTGISDNFGRSLSVTVTNGRITQINDSIGSVVYAYYNGTNRLQTVSSADGSKYQFEYHPTNYKLTIVKDALDYILEKHDYDPTTGWATTSEKQGGVEKYTFDYTHTNDQINPYTTVTDANQKVSKFYFDRSKGRTVASKVEGLCGCSGGSQSAIYEYDSRLNLTKETKLISQTGSDTVSQIKEFTYDSNGNRLSATEKIETVTGTTPQTTNLGTVTFTYNSLGQILTYTDRMNGIWTNTYDANGNLLTTKDPLDYVTTVEYPATNNKGLPDSIKDARDNTTKFKWFASSGLLQEIEDANGKKTNFTYDARGRGKTITNALNHVTTYNYFDDTQRKIEIIYPNADKITYKYDIRRLLESVTDERGKITVYEFDSAYRLKKITDPVNHSRELDYDLMSNLKWQKDALGNQTDYVYDDFNRLKEIQYPLAETGATRLIEKFEYDSVGRLKKHYDTANRLTEYGYDDANRTNTVTNAELETTTRKYNQRFQTIEVKDALDQVYNFSYDALGRQLAQTRAGATMSYEYDAVGNRTKRTDYAGRITNYEYDDLNRLTNILYGSPVSLQSTYTYDDISRLKTATNEAGTVTLNYDNRNRVESTTDVFDHTVAYEYEQTSTVNQKRLKFDGAMYAVYNFDDADRLANIVDSNDSTTISFGYDNADRLISKTLPNGITTTYEYDGMSRLKRLKDVSSTATLFDRQYAYNPANQISQITEPSQTRNFGYDNVDRLISMTNGTANESYSFDTVGNRTASHLSTSYTYQTGQFNRLASTATANYSYDANGNMASKTDLTNSWTFTWDYENRMTNASDGASSVSYEYDALDRRTKRIEGTNTTKFIYDGQDVLVDDNAGTLTKYQNGLGIDNKLKISLNGTAKYFLADHLGSTNALTDASGAITEQTAYDSFGNATNNLSTRYQFTGREFDNFTGLHYYRARFYDAQIGRFISEDPIGFAGGDINLYGYVWNNPIIFTDPSGKFGWIVAGAAIGGGTSLLFNAIEQAASGCKFDWWSFANAGLSGGIAGGLTAAFPVSGIIRNAALGGLFNGAGQVGANLVTGNPLSSGVGSSVFGGVVGGAATGTFKKLVDGTIPEQSFWELNPFHGFIGDSLGTGKGGLIGSLTRTIDSAISPTPCKCQQN